MSQLSTGRLLMALMLANTCRMASAGSTEQRALQDDLAGITAGFNGRVGVGVEDDSGMTCINGEQHFSLQSVMKLVVGMAVIEAGDNNGWWLDERFVVTSRI